MSYDNEIEELRRRRELELRRQLTTSQEQAEAQQQIEQQKRTLLRRILTQEARQRLNRLKMVKPEFAAQLELQLIQVVQSGKISIPITDKQFKAILSKLQSGKREINIRRR
jgi:programmed cell death protein 5